MTVLTDMATPLLADLVDPAELAAEIDAKFISRKTHPTLPLSIYTYTRACQYDRHWTPATIACRGLVVDDETGGIVAWPFPKFFNTPEHDLGYDYARPLPDEPFEIFDKVDGSLGIVFHYAGAWCVASKGSFISEQAQWAQRWLDARDTSALIPGRTYLAEIVYPQNRIVVNNGDEETLVLLAVYGPDGHEISLDEHLMPWPLAGGRVVRSWRVLPLPELVKLAATNEHLDGTAATGSDAEGWVIRFASGLRAKVKFAEYMRLHKVLTGVNARDIWRALAVTVIGPDVDAKRAAQALGCSVGDLEAMRRVSDPLGALVAGVPDEFDAWVRGICAELSEHAEALEAEIEEAYAGRRHLHNDRAAFARSVQQLDSAVKAAMFLKLDGKDVALHIWRAIKPETVTPFREDEDA
jgi:RNA ligase